MNKSVCKTKGKNLHTCLIIAFLIFSIESNAQRQYIPVLINTISKTPDIHSQIGLSLNNFGINANAGITGQKPLYAILSLQTGQGAGNFDPLNLNDNANTATPNQRITGVPKRMLYTELLFGLKSLGKFKKLGLASGLSAEFEDPGLNIFIELEFHNEGRLIETSYLDRLIYMVGPSGGKMINQSAIEGKFKIGDLRILNQFGFSYEFNLAYIRPCMTFGLEYLF